MFEYYFTFRSLTYAQSAQITLQKNGIAAILDRIPKRLAALGCGFSLRVSARFADRALQILRTMKSAYSHVYRVFDTGRIEEVLR